MPGFQILGEISRFCLGIKRLAPDYFPWQVGLGGNHPAVVMRNQRQINVRGQINIENIRLQTIKDIAIMHTAFSFILIPTTQ